MTADLVEWSERTRGALIHISLEHPYVFAVDLAPLLAANSILLGTGRGKAENVRAQIDRSIAEVQKEVCGGCMK